MCVALSVYLLSTNILIVQLANALAISPKPTLTHFALAALSAHAATHPGSAPTAEVLTKGINAIIGDIELPEKELEEAVGELYASLLRVYRDVADILAVNAPRPPTCRMSPPSLVV